MAQTTGAFKKSVFLFLDTRGREILAKKLDYKLKDFI
jgi:hypothetical protein